MSTCKKWSSLFLIPFLGIISLSSHASALADSLTLYTPYTKISVPPGEAIEYNIDIINNSKEIRNAELWVTGVPKGWNYSLKCGILNVGQISILPSEKKNFSLRVEVPLKVKKGSYRFRVAAAGSESLPLVVIVSEEGTFKTEFTSQQPNMEGNSSLTFTFNANLINRTSDKQLYALMADMPRGWNVTFKSYGQQVTSVSIEPANTQAVTIDIKPPENIEAGKYKIPVRAMTSATSASLDLEVVITGSYKMELTTPTGLLSSDITAGGQKRIELQINNRGSSELSDIKLNFAAPANWDVTFDPKKIDKLQSGKAAQVFATIKADKRAIPGDYVTNMEASTLETSSKASFRISVETPLLWGWVGILIIIAALGSVYYLFRKYGRR
jgi:uncharacterized membrane protein